jgi:hypothetical protein
MGRGSTYGPLVVDVHSECKEHAEQKSCWTCCPRMHSLFIPCFGPDSNYGWQSLNFVYEKTLINKMGTHMCPRRKMIQKPLSTGRIHSIHEDSDAHIEGVDRMERFLLHLGREDLIYGSRELSRTHYVRPTLVPHTHGTYSWLTRSNA